MALKIPRQEINCCSIELKSPRLRALYNKTIIKNKTHNTLIKNSPSNYSGSHTCGCKIAIHKRNRKESADKER